MVKITKMLHHTHLANSFKIENRTHPKKISFVSCEYEIIDKIEFSFSFNHKF